MSLLVVLTTLALAQEPADPPAADTPDVAEEPAPTRPSPRVPAALRVPLEPCEVDPADIVAGVAEGDQESYLCAVRTPEALDPLVTAILANPEDEAFGPRYTRALTLHLAARSHDPWEAGHLRLLNPADRRLLADAVKARRGRRSPSVEHDAVFAQQPWYTVDERYTDNKLSRVERDNIDLANDPPPPPPPAAPEAGFGRVGEQPLLPAPQREAGARTCGCATSPAGAWWLATPLLLLGMRRRS